MITGKKNYREIKYFHPTGKPMPNGSHIQRGGYLQECRANKKAYKLDETVHGGQDDNSTFKGGVVTLPTDIKEDRYGEVVDMAVEAVMAVEDRLRIQRQFFELFKNNKEEHVGAYSVGHSFKGQYVGANGETYNGESLSVEVNGLGSRWLAFFAGMLANKLHRAVLVKDLNGDKILLVDSITNKDLDLKTQLTDLMAFRKGLRRIDEDSINRILQHGQHGFIIIGNKINDGNLFKQLRTSKYAYTPIYSGSRCQDGVIDDFKPSYIVYCHGKGNNEDSFDFNDLYEFGTELVEKFKQDSFYVSKPNEVPFRIDGDGNKVNADIHFESLYHNGGPSCYGDRVRRTQYGEVFI